LAVVVSSQSGHIFPKLHFYLKKINLTKKSYLYVLGVLCLVFLVHFQHEKVSGARLFIASSFPNKVNNFQQQQRAAAPPVTTNGHASAKRTTNAAVGTGKFDEIQHRLYDKASKPANVARKPFVLDDSWVRGTGGLVDDDRVALGELYFNANSVFEFGLGDSTLIAAALGVPWYSGMDSDAVWVAQARTTSNMDHFRFYFGDTGQTGAW
jgi:hypothetical protein